MGVQVVRYVVVFVVCVVVGSYVVVYFLPVVLAGGVGGYESSTVTFESNDGEQHTVSVRVADTTRKKIVGLSQSSSLGSNEGMIFIHKSEEERSYAMYSYMSVGLDIVFVSANGTITSVHHAPVPSVPFSMQRYSGSGKYVVEVPLGWTSEHNVTVGDSVSSPVFAEGDE